MNINFRIQSWMLVALAALGVGAGLGFRSLDRPAFSSEPLTNITVNPSDPSKLLAASKQSLYIRGEEGNWNRLLSLAGQPGSIQRLFSHPELADKIFALTEEGILECDLKRKRAKLIFHPAFSKKGVRGFGIHPNEPETLYVGTKQGLFASGDGGKTWLRPFRWPENQPIEFVAFLPSNPPTLLVGTSRELFFSKDEGETFESGFSLPFDSKEEPEKNSEEDSENSSSPSRFTSIAFSSEDPRKLWIGTSAGVFKSEDGGVGWEKLPETGLGRVEIVDLAFSERTGELFAATSRGVAKYLSHERRWEMLKLPLTKSPSSLALQTRADGKEVLWVASGHEVYEWILTPPETPSSENVFLPSPERIQLLQKLFEFEPTIREVQKAAIHYGDLGNGKIKRWQWGSRMRSFIPKVGVGKDFSANTNVDIDRGGTNNPDFFIAGPESRREAWNFDVTWELGDLLYSSAQPSIDSRAKLLVELRESILGEVTRIYFERRRIQTELVFSPPKTPQEHFELLLQLDELTAQLDALTNGFLSRELEKIYAQEPELKELWAAALDKS